MAKKSQASPRVESDYYPTDLDVVRKGMRKLREKVELYLPKGFYEPKWCIEPGSGAEGPFGIAAGEILGDTLEKTIVTVDCDTEGLDNYQPWRRFHFKMDYFEWCSKYGKRQFDLAPTNPPYSLAEEFMRATAGWVLSKRGLGMFLLRLGFLESQERIPLWNAELGRTEVRLLHTSVLCRRPGFKVEGGTDKTSYAYYIFCRRGDEMDRAWRYGQEATQDWIWE